MLSNLNGGMNSGQKLRVFMSAYRVPGQGPSKTLCLEGTSWLGSDETELTMLSRWLTPAWLTLYKFLIFFHGYSVDVDIGVKTKINKSGGAGGLVLGALKTFVIWSCCCCFCRQNCIHWWDYKVVSPVLANAPHSLSCTPLWISPYLLEIAFYTAGQSTMARFSSLRFVLYCLPKSQGRRR